jgi:acyl transferase domain-containing protein/acyl carrier protein/ribosomal protein S18 acetylase RimI-like enzyme
MADRIHLYADRYVSAPVIVACRRRGLFDLLREAGPLGVEELSRRLGGRPVGMRIAVWILEALGWLSRTEEGIYALLPEASREAEIPDEEWRPPATGPAVRESMPAGLSLMADGLSACGEFLAAAEELLFGDGPSRLHEVLAAAAGAGYFLRSAPVLGGSAKISVLEAWMEARTYRIRMARPGDLDELDALEAACWPSAVRSPRESLARRIEVYPEGQWVIEEDGRVVGAVFSQRIEDPDRLRTVTYLDVESLHDPHARIPQLLALNVLPERQGLSLGDQLLEFVLQYFALSGAVERIVGVTRCSRFADAGCATMEEYVLLRDDTGQLADPVLRFHELHGAVVREALPGYRPGDTENQDAGVRVDYDLSRWMERFGKTRNAARVETAKLDRIVADSIRSVLGPQRSGAFAATAALMDMGLDSADLMGLRALLGERLGVDIDPAFFFSHGTSEAIARQLKRMLGPHAQHGGHQGGAAAGEESGNGDRDEPGPAAGAGAVLTAGGEKEDRAGDARNQPVGDGARDEPIAIIGMSCRFPGGADDPERFWDLLRDGVDAITEAADSRIGFPGGFLSDVDQFDADFFRISPREANRMDPQQRILLELAWHALEDAGMDPLRLQGSRTGVFAGQFGHDYETLQVRAADADALDAYYATGSDASVLAGRLAYFLGLQGPVFTIQTACSSSLVAVHQACLSLRSGECGTALAAGVNFLLSRELGCAFTEAGMLAPDGRCKTFDASADGYVRGEGAAVVVLKPLADAVRDGDRILAVIRGSAIRHDGASNGLTAPNGSSQAEVIREALWRAGISPGDVSYIEAHGTGTSLGDPVEVSALKSVFGPGRPPDRPLAIGSVKTNIGHTEAAAGIAGLIKVVLSMRHGIIPPHLHFARLNPLIDLDAFPARIPVRGEPWERGGAPRVAGVSSFGFSGTNAHVVVQEPPPSAALRPRLSRPFHLVTLSAKQAPALSESAGRWARQLAADPDASLADICATANQGRAHLKHRLAVVAESTEDLARQLADAAGVARGVVPDDEPAPVVFLFTGQGSQYVGMARELYLTQPVFRRTLDRCAEALRPHLEADLLEVLYSEPSAGDGTSRLDQTAYTQPAIFAVEVALAEVWRSWGVQPAAVMGHSVGEVAAACVAGIFSLEDGLRLIAARGALMQALPPDGEMVVVRAGEARVAAALAPERDRVALAALNGPSQTVISGEREAIQRVVAELEADGLRCSRLPVSHAFHSPLMESMQPAFREVAEQIAYARPRIPLVSNVTGTADPETCASADYWVRHIREPVRYMEGLRALHAQGFRVFLEIGPQPVLTGLGAGVLTSGEEIWLPGPRRGRSDWRQLLGTLGELYVRGQPVDWASVDAGYVGSRISLPGYAFQRQRYWLKEGGLVGAAGSAARVGELGGLPGLGAHPLLGGRVVMALETRDTLYASGPLPERAPWLRDHRVFDRVVVPAAAFVEMALAAAKEAWGSGRPVVVDLAIPRALAISADAGPTIQTVVSPEPDERRSAFRICGAVGGGGGDEEEPRWTVHATGSLLPDAGPAPPAVDTAGLAESFGAPRSVEAFYAACAERGLHYGPGFCALEGLWVGDGRALGRARLPDAVRDDPDRYLVHPVLLDAAIQVALALLPDDDDRTVYLPVGLERFELFRPAGAEIWCLARVEAAAPTPDVLTVALSLFDEAGEAIAKARGLTLQRTTASALQAPAGAEEWREWLYGVVWQSVPAPQRDDAGERPPRHWIVLEDESEMCRPLIERLRARGDRCTVVRPGDEYRCAGESEISLNPGLREDFDRLIEEAAGVQGVVQAWGLDAAGLGDPDGAVLSEAVQAVCDSTLMVMQALIASEPEEFPEVWVLTRGAVSARPGEDPFELAQAPLWGLGKVIDLELPECRCIRLDLDPAGGDAEAWVAEISDSRAEDTENQLAFRGGERLAARLVPWRRAVSELAGDRRDVPADGPYRLAASGDGTLTELGYRTVERAAPGRGQVEIRVRATGLNFIDVLDALGLLPFERAGLGLECAGTISAVGDGVDGIAVGDEVVAIAEGCFAEYALTRAELTAPRPSCLSAEEAASIPVNFLTAQYAIEEVAGIRRGERILIHAAAGGTGLAAVQVARRAGAEVLGTASPGKWEVLREAGVSECMNSRTLDFAEEVPKRTGGEGVDVVLNSLAGEFIPRSLALLRAGGRFLEIGKTGVWSAAEAEAFRPGISYALVDLYAMCRDEPARVQGLFREVMARFERGEYRPVPIREFPSREVVAAFRTMQQGKHVGKLVLSAARREADGQEDGVFAGAGCYLIVGGLSGLGLAAARWMGERGARRLVLASRRGEVADADRGILDDLQREGVEVEVVRVDVADAAETAALIERLVRGDPPLRGILHAAGVLDDGTLQEQDPRRFAAVLPAKVQGAWNLHQSTRGAPLEFFVMYSSVASLLGSAGQANYAAANAFLDALAAHRRANGLPGLSINWGPWSKIGLAVRSETGGTQWTRQGIGWISPQRGLECLGYLLDQPLAQAGVVPVDWPRYRPAPHAARFVEAMRRDAAPASAMSGFLQRLAEAPEGRRWAMIVTEVRSQVAEVLDRTTHDEIELTQGFFDLGLDSLTSVELRNRLQHLLGESLPPALTLNYPTVEKLARFLMDRIGAAAEAAAGDRPAPPPAAPPPAAPAVPDVGERIYPSEPIAVVGMGCRLPGGVDDPEAFWALLRDGVDAIRDVPAEHWDADAYYDADPHRPGRMSTRKAGVVDGLREFDAEFFGISPREAAGMDPQQRLLMEVSYEAMEHAGMAADSLAESRTGVFIGICTADNLQRLSLLEPEAVDAYLTTGNLHCVAAGRLSYWYGFLGPSLSVDTACSSSLVSVHLACQSLRAGECEMALAGGVNRMAWAGTSISFSQSGMLAADGTCKTFDDAADGYVRGEGCGVIVLKRLRDAVAGGDRILAVIRGSAVNQDGRSSGLTVPNVVSQGVLIRDALEHAGVDPARVSYIEAHGTGTALGDPIEMEALATVFGPHHTRDRPLHVGSVKTNIGHLEAAAGIAGLMKTILAMAHEEIPPNLHFRTPSGRIPWESIPISVPTERTRWTSGGAPRVAGISSFGFSGTNAHVVIEEAPAERVVPATASRPVHLLALSARSDDALNGLIRRYAAHLREHADLEIADVCYAANAGRSHFRCRLGVMAGSTGELRGILEALERGEGVSGVVRRPSGKRRGRPEVAFLFTGQGAQFVGMGRDLYETQPVFRRVMDRCDRILREYLDRPLLEVLYGVDGAGDADERGRLLDQTAYTQPALFAVEFALAEVWRSWGIEPAAVMGHSVGEVVAACVAGVFSLEDGLKLIAHRGRLIQALPAGGAMAAITVPESRVAEALAAESDRVSIAALNGPEQTVISGDAEDVQRIAASFEAEGARAVRLQVSHAFHSARMDPMLAEFERIAAGVSFASPRLDVVSCVTGEWIGEEMCNAGYWTRQIRRPVRFADAMASIAARGLSVYVEAGPKPVLLGMGRRCVSDAEAVWLPSLRPGRSDWGHMLESLCRLYVLGHRVDWAGVDRDYASRRVVMPGYPWQRSLHWVDTPRAGSRRAEAGEDDGGEGANPCIRCWAVGATPPHRRRRGFLPPRWVRGGPATWPTIGSSIRRYFPAPGTWRWRWPRRNG